LYWRKKNKETIPVNVRLFTTEEEFEQTVFDTPAVLGDIYLLKRQVRGGGKPGIPDIIGVDAQGKVCVVEMKNTSVDASVIPQVLGYAIWAESSPDALKNLWLQANDRPEELEPDWDDYDVRIVVVAPNFDGSTLEYVNKIRYFVDLIEVSRWSLEGDSWLLVNKLEALSAKRVKPVSGLITYDKAFYEENHNPQNVEGFMKLCGAMTRFAQERGWPVQPKFNKDYFCCKVGFFNAFGVFWESVRSYALFFDSLEKIMGKLRLG